MYHPFSKTRGASAHGLTVRDYTQKTIYMEIDVHKKSYSAAIISALKKCLAIRQSFFIEHANYIF
jgi:hypothetical protein